MSSTSAVREFFQKHIFFLLGGVCVFIVGIIFIASQRTATDVIRDGEIIFDAQDAKDVPVSSSAVETDYIIVHIDGAVNLPGVFSLPASARVEDALLKAGGATADANLSGINRADFLQDGMKINIPAQGEDLDEIFIFATEPAGRGGINSDGLININTATLTELQTLPGIGSVRAESIISFRETHGNFSNIEELINISGIGPSIMERLRDRVTVE
ncbi:MAG: helix-hairpin-helix domain-containing protein [Defluviitaleaceae bacterium]|nr:helix-hairpin-helix domain-containing protein [Defluviitaleaceae bacterium]